MNTLGKKSGSNIKPAMLGLLYGLFATMPAVAEDIEIYTGSISSTSALQATANVLFILDTSGSMDAIVSSAIGTYDPAVTYPASCFDANTIYVDVNIGGSDGVNGYCTGSYSLSGLRKFSSDPTVFVCQAGATTIATEGFYTDRAAQYRTRNNGNGGNRWRNISSRSSFFNKKVECKADDGIHGEGGAAKYAKDQADPTGFTTNSNQGINWNNENSRTLYGANYLNFLISSPPVSKTRLRVMQDAMTNVVNTTSGINIGLMRFDRYANGGMVVTPMGPIDTTRAAFIVELEEMYHRGGTPLSESLYEGALYFQGKSVDYGDDSYAAIQPDGDVFSKLSHDDSRAPSGGSTYKSPIVSECQKNYIVLLTDGKATVDSGVSGSPTRQSNIGVDTVGGCNTSSSSYSNCLDEIALAIATNDQSSSIDGKQVISTFTIGLQLDDPLLSATAQASKGASQQGDYFIADDAASLNEAFIKIVRNVLDTDASFSSPAVSVNAFNRSTHLNDLYFTLFKPADNEHWAGNLKKYKLIELVDTNDFDNDTDVTEELPFIVDATFSEAVDVTTGFFADGSQSFWTLTPDGPSVTVGGVVDQLTNTRNVYTYTDSYSSSNGVFTPDTPDLTNAVNALDKANTKITDAMLGTTVTPPFVPPTPYRESLLDWAMGIDVKDESPQPAGNGDFTDARLDMGDPLHSQPALIQYGVLGTDSDGDGLNDPDLVAYVATNDGYLQAFDTVTGQEIWSFVPQELLPNLATLFENDGSSSKIYGLDGDVVAWVNDVDKDGNINGTDHVYIYVSMRRGGNNIYSFDVTNRNKPVFRWVTGQVGAFSEIGQTWSSVNVRKMKDNTGERDVLIFGGGYDTNQDSVTVRTPDSVGRAVYIVDADTGQHLWSAGPTGTGQTLTVPEMQYSIPGRVKPLDINGDGFIDRIYAGDMGGQILRFDFVEGSAWTAATGGRIADLAVDGDVTQTRRFYYPPDASLIFEQGQSPYIALVASSGWRSHPLDVDVEDKIYMLREDDIYSAPSTYTTIVEGDLYDTTLNTIGVATGGALDTEIANLGSSKGWFIDLDSDGVAFKGEKGLAEPLILGGRAIVTTFLPENLAVSSTVCTPQAGTGFAYFLNITDGTPVYETSTTTNNERGARHRDTALTRSGIPPSPRIIIGKTPTLCIGTECEESPIDLSLKKMYWYEVEQ